MSDVVNEKFLNIAGLHDAMQLCGNMYSNMHRRKNIANQGMNKLNKAIQIMQNKARKYVWKPKKSVACELLHSKGKIKI